MSEKNPNVEFNEYGQVINELLASDMASEQKPYWEDARSAKELGKSLELKESAMAIGEAVLAIETRGINAVQGIEDGWVDTSESAATQEATRHSPEVKESIWSPEHIKEFVGNHTMSAVISSTLFDHRIRSKNAGHRTLADRGQYKIAEFLREELAGSLAIVGEESQGFSEKGVSEVVTVVPMNSLTQDGEAGYQARRGLATKFGSKNYIMMYKTMTRSGPFNDAQQEQYGRPGRYATFNVILTHEEVEPLLAQIQERPEIVRDIMDRLASSGDLDASKGSYRDSATGSGQTIAQQWNGEGGQKARPPYDMFKEMNGGINRIALRTDLNTGPDEAQILEF
jgi:hypothetical protein